MEEGARDRILIVDADSDVVRFLDAFLRSEGFETLSAVDGEGILEKVRVERPDLVLLDRDVELGGFEICRQLRDDPRTWNVCVIMLAAGSSADLVTGLSAGADDFVIKPFNPVELHARIGSTLCRTRLMRDRNPLTGMPGNTAITAELQRRIERELPFAAVHVDLDNFKAFNDHYGFVRGDEAIKLVGALLHEVAVRHEGAGGFVGHVGGDDFVMVCTPETAEQIAREIVGRFDEEVRSLYDPEDLRRGHITVTDRRGRTINFPIMTVSIGISTNARRRIGSHWEASEVSTEMKRVAKRAIASTYAIDRRVELAARVAVPS